MTKNFEFFNRGFGEMGDKLFGKGFPKGVPFASEIEIAEQSSSLLKLVGFADVPILKLTETISVGSTFGLLKKKLVDDRCDSWRLTV